MSTLSPEEKIQLARLISLAIIAACCGLFLARIDPRGPRK